jgi:hypothetical protein
MSKVSLLLIATFVEEPCRFFRARKEDSQAY